MRKHADWMTQTGERILEFVHDNGNYQPSAIRDGLADTGVDLDYHVSHVGRCCRELEDHGLLENLGGGTYSITELGEEFLSGELDAGTIDE